MGYRRFKWPHTRDQSPCLIRHSADTKILVGDKYPSAHVRGIDLTPIQPEWVPANVSFVVDDCTLDWLERDVDLAHFRFMVMILKDIPAVLGHAYEYVVQGGLFDFIVFVGISSSF